MKKTVSKVMIVIGAVLLIAAAVAKLMGRKSVSIIGGADGPTSIFIVGRVSPGWMLPAAVVGVIALAVGVF
ncbi:MAG: sodium ion-translocating decarboxylase subunit beta, partial [Lachnospiraceae bacterium]|nr:sodium ion-translocating decarboxylase subunit beta [Lachnospiraceae bacterium]